MTPIFPLIIEPFIEHFNHLDKVLPTPKSPTVSLTLAQTLRPQEKREYGLVVRELRYFVHLGTRRSPRVIRGGFTSLELDIGIALCVVFDHWEFRGEPEPTTTWSKERLTSDGGARDILHGDRLGYIPTSVRSLKPSDERPKLTMRNVVEPFLAAGTTGR
jgi:hypothetical protein